MRIRAVQMSDAAAITAIIRNLGWFSHLIEETARDTEARVARHLARCLADESHSVLVAEQPEHSVVGYVAAHWLPYLILSGPEGYVSELFVAPAGRGLGVGSALLAEVERLARARGCSRLMLLNMRDRESYVRGFYAARGWQERPGAANFVKRLAEERPCPPSRA
jgi:GNAT superfamily N-acetyltransferase